ncbi:MAG: hypothetical protein ACOCUH_03150 [Bacteriovoracia bacterium]
MKKILIRNRKEGWQHAKLSGHDNEDLILSQLECLDSRNQLLENLRSRLGKNLQQVKKLTHSGIKEVGVPCIIGGLTKGKTDLSIEWSDNSKSRISIKKSLGGQVYLISTSRFINGFSRHFKEVEPEIQKALMLYFGEDKETLEILNRTATFNQITRNYELKKRRLTFESLKSHNKNMAEGMIQWFKDNIDKIVLFCFSRGLVEDKECWADYIWYKNLLKENNIDEIVSILQLAQNCKKTAVNNTMPGARNGGSTIQLPFGFVQWHQGKMQFHHSYEKITKLTKQY